MYKDGYSAITNIDFSEEVINIMQERCKEMSSMKCTVLAGKMTEQGSLWMSWTSSSRTLLSMS